MIPRRWYIWPVFVVSLAAAFGSCMLSIQTPSDTIEKRAYDALKKHDHETAIKLFTELIRRNPKDAYIYNWRGFAYHELKDYDRALNDYTEAIRHSPKYADACYGRGLCYYEKRDYAKAVEDFDAAIRLNLGTADLYYSRSLAHYFQDDYAKAKQDCTKAIALKNDHGDAYYWRAVVCYELRELDSAIEDYTEAIRLDPKAMYAHAGRGNALVGQKKYDAAIADFNAEIRIHPESAHGYEALAWFRASCVEAAMRDGKKALELAERACKLTSWDNPHSLEALAAAYAETGEFGKAVEWQRKALRLFDEKTELQNSKKAPERLKVYMDSRPWRWE